MAVLRAFKKPLSAIEEKIYVEKMRQGDNEARDILIEHNLRLVTHIIKKYTFTDKDIDDLISIGTIGLIKAVDTFNPEKASKLGTYAAKCIENELLMMLRSDKKKSKEVSLYEPIGADKEGNMINLLDVLESEDVDVVEQYDLAMKKEWLHVTMEEVLTKREYEIILRRYGIGGNEEITQRELAERMGISRSYVSRIEKKALLKLRIIYNKTYKDHK